MNIIIRNFQEISVDIIIDITQMFLFWLPGGNILKGKILTLIHIFIAMFGNILFFTFPPRSIMRILYLFLCLFVLITNLLFRGCVITRAEQRLTGSKETILDKLLIFTGISVNRDTRYAITLGSIITIFSLITFSVVADYIWVDY
jgi:hypothetical protein